MFRRKTLGAMIPFKLFKFPPPKKKKKEKEKSLVFSKVSRKYGHSSRLFNLNITLWNGVFLVVDSSPISGQPHDLNIGLCWLNICYFFNALVI